MQHGRRPAPMLARRVIIGCLILLFYAFPAVSQTFTRTYQLGGGGLQVACCNFGSGLLYGFTPLIQDPTLSGNVRITSISVSANGNVIGTDPNGIAGTSWQIFAGPSSFGFPAPGQLTAPTISYQTYSSTAPTQLFFAEGSVFTPPANYNFTGTYDFVAGTLTTDGSPQYAPGGGILVSASSSSFTVTNGLFLQVLMWGGAVGSNVAFSNISVTITGTTTGSGSKFITIDYPGATLTAVRQINNHGVMAGRYILNGVIHAYILQNGTFTTIDVPGALETAAWGINDNGDVVGRYFDPAVNRDHGFLYHNGAFTTVDPPGTVETFALGINNLAFWQQALSGFQDVSNKGNSIRTLINIGGVFKDEGEHATAKKTYEQALALAREINDRDAISLALASIGTVLDAQGHGGDARKMLDDALAMDTANGQPNPAVDKLIDLGDVLQRLGDLAGASGHYQDALRLAQAAGDKSMTAYALMGLGSVALKAAQLSESRKQYERALSLRKELGEKDGIAQTEVALSELLLEEGHTSEAEAAVTPARDHLRSAGLKDDETSATAVLVRTQLAPE